jgi:hypothetical protein
MLDMWPKSMGSLGRALPLLGVSAHNQKENHANSKANSRRQISNRSNAMKMIVGNVSVLTGGLK